MESEKKPLTEAEVIRVEEIAQQVFVVSIDFTTGFIPGQVVGVTLNHHLPPRLYSIASAPEARELQILFDVKESGELSPRLSELKPGNKLLLTEPFGTFTDTAGPAWWIATGTGIAPFLSLLRSGLSANKTLIHGARSSAGFYYQKYLADTLGRFYIRCCSKCDGDEFFQGRLTRYLENLDLSNEIQKYYLCGRSEMVVEVRDILIKKGIPFHSIFSEIYF